MYVYISKNTYCKLKYFVDKIPIIQYKDLEVRNGYCALKILGSKKNN